jgi:alpha-glucosidase
MEKSLWWRDGIIYQIYPRSFADGNADGLGDLPGITARLDYLADLGVDALWLSPFYPTPDRDFGYDISDYCNVDPRFGTLDDFDVLVEQAHRRGLRIIVDMVMNHTSDQHPWFQEARRSRENPKRDWYIWSQHPNNWQASFGGKAWEFDPETGEYYLHLFTTQQPDVNWRNPQVRQAQLDAFRFWLRRGVDGFRLDVFNAYFKEAHLKDNPPRLGLIAFDRQRHIYDIDQPEMHPLLKELRAILDSYPERYAVGETYISTPEKSVSYCGADKLHAAFSFDFTSLALIYPWSPRFILARLRPREQIFTAAGVWPTTVLSNHDLPRAVSRYSRGEDDRMAKVIMTLLLTLRGTPYIYQGEEIGMRNIQLSRREILDPPGKHYWPFYKGRDVCRAPMQWDSSVHAGFSPVAPWLKVHPDYVFRNVRAQQADPHSLLNFTKALISLRKHQPALQHGDFIPVSATRHVLAYQRKQDDECLLIVLNFSRRQRSFRIPGGFFLGKCLFSNPGNPTHLIGKKLLLAPYEVAIWQMHSPASP